MTRAPYEWGSWRCAVVARAWMEEKEYKENNGSGGASEGGLLPGHEAPLLLPLVARHQHVTVQKRHVIGGVQPVLLGEVTRLPSADEEVRHANTPLAPLALIHRQALHRLTA